MQKQKKLLPRQGGFTLIELLVVLAIIGILAGIIMVAMNSARAKGRDSKRQGDMRQTATALEQYYIQYGTYPTGTLSVTIAGASLSDPESFNGSAPFVPDYLPQVPEAPTPADGDCTNNAGKGNNNYWYESPDDGSTYSLTFCLGNLMGDWQPGIRTLTPDGIQ